MNCGTRGCENLRWNLSFFFFFFLFCIFHPTAVCRENIMQMPLIFYPMFTSWGRRVCSYVVSYVRKKIWAVRVKKCVLCKFWKENVRSMVFKLGLHFKLFLLNPVISLDLLAPEKRSESVPSAKGSVLAWLVLAGVPYSCWRWTVAPEPILPCQSWPKDATIPSYLSPHNWCWLETSEMGQNCWVVFFHVT